MVFIRWEIDFISACTRSISWPKIMLKCFMLGLMLFLSWDNSFLILLKYKNLVRKPRLAIAGWAYGRKYKDKSILK
jgi:hypothetical protein